MNSLSLESKLSTVDIVYTPAEFAVQASIVALVLKGGSARNVTAWTSGNVKYKIILYDRAVACRQTNLGHDGSVPLTRRIVAVPWGERLVLRVLVCDGGEAKTLELNVEIDRGELTVTQGLYELQVKIQWTPIVGMGDHKRLFEHVGGISVLRG
ncbi:hypothetical protein ACP4OV_023467 [Aristida adscensionis]